jgi:hypothetical protein
VNCEVQVDSMEYYLWRDGTVAVNQTAVTVIIDVSLNVTQTSTRTDTQMIQSYYYNRYIADCEECFKTHGQVVFGAEGTPSLSKSGTIM